MEVVVLPMSQGGVEEELGWEAAQQRNKQCLRMERRELGEPRTSVRWPPLEAAMPEKGWCAQAQGLSRLAAHLPTLAHSRCWN